MRIKLTIATAMSIAILASLTLTACGIKSVKIGNQTWMAENLNIDIQGSKCYGDNPENCKKYGRLYPYGVAMQACPKGWHLPSDKEWQMLVDFVGADAGKKLKAKAGWNDNYDGSSGNGTDEYGFSALPGGYSNSKGSSYVGVHGYWWSSTEYIRRMYSVHGSVGEDNRYNDELYSVRCIKD